MGGSDEALGVDYVMCAAGAGSRVREISPTVPKPLLQLEGASLLEWSLESVDFFPGDRLIVLAQAQHALSQMAPRLSKRWPFLDLHVVELAGLTSGQLATVLCGHQLWRRGRPLVILSADTYFRSRGLHEMLTDPACAGAIPCSRQPGDAWSFCRLASDGRRVLEVREKERISDWCSVGYYMFRDADVFLREAQRVLAASPPGREDYVSAVYPGLLAQGLEMWMAPVDLFKPMGSMAQLKTYWGADLAKMRAENSRAKKIVVDLDNTLTIDASATRYADKAPRQPVVARIRELHAQGYEIVVHSARRMRTHKNDEGKIVAEIGQDTIAWLERHQIPFSSLKFGKPYAENGFYVDDRTVRPDEFVRLSVSQIEALLQEASP